MTIDTTVTQVAGLWKGGGTVHAMLPEALQLHQTWCGVRPQFRHRIHPGTLEDVSCPVCVRRVAIGSPLSRR